MDVDGAAADPAPLDVDPMNGAFIQRVWIKSDLVSGAWMENANILCEGGSENSNRIGPSESVCPRPPTNLRET